MTITSTEFQQRVGYYLGLVDKGEIIEIKKMKPKNKIYELKSKKIIKKKIKNETKWQKLLKELDKYKVEMVYPKGVKNSVDAQRKARGYKV